MFLSSLLLEMTSSVQSSQPVSPQASSPLQQCFILQYFELASETIFPFLDCPSLLRLSICCRELVQSQIRSSTLSHSHSTKGLQRSFASFLNEFTPSQEQDESDSILLQKVRRIVSIYPALVNCPVRFRYKIKNQRKGIQFDSAFHVTPLYIAVTRGPLALVKLLVASGADVNAFSSSGDTALHQAITSNRLEIVQALLSSGANPSCRSRCLSRTPPLLTACKQSNLAMVRLLLGAGASAQEKDVFGWNGLGVAAYVGCESILKELLASTDCDITQQSSTLVCAVLNNHLNIVEILLERGVEPDCFNRQGRTPLGSAARGGHAPIVRVLLAAGADVNLRENTVEGDTPLILACEQGHADVVELLLAAGACASVVNSAGKVALTVTDDRKCMSLVRGSLALQP